jgi:glycosyltransferase involved in cell wall biosynthesis
MNSKKNLENPLISIVIATYNGEKFLRKQLDSIFKQTYKNLEIIAVDDCSSDSTVTILNEYAARYDNFKVFVHDCNVGYIKNFERGFLQTTGNYIAPCDQDDIWMPNKIDVLLNNMNHCEIAYCNSAFIDDEDNLIGDKLSDRTNATNFDSPVMYLAGASAPGHAMLLKKQVAFDAMPFPEIFSHDNWLGFVATFKGSVKFVNEVLVHYRRHHTNVFSTINKQKKIKESKPQRLDKARQRMQTLYQKCPDCLPEKEIIAQIYKSYESYSLRNNFLRMRLFYKYRNQILRYKKHSELHRKLYCIKVFFKII